MRRAFMSYVIERSSRNETVRLGGRFGFSCARKSQRHPQEWLRNPCHAEENGMVHKLLDEWSKAKDSEVACHFSGESFFGFTVSASRNMQASASTADPSRQPTKTDIDVSPGVLKC